MIIAMAASAAALVAGARAEADGWGGSVAATSDYVVRGITRSDGDPSMQIDLHKRFRTGWFGGLSTATVRLGPDDPISAEIGAYAGYEQPLGNDFSGGLAATHYDYPGSNARNQYRYDEVRGDLSYRDRVFLSAAILPDATIESRRGKAENQPAFAVDAASHLPLWRAWSFNAGLGYYDLHQLVGVGYLYWNAGIGYDFGRLQLDLSYIGTNATAKSLYYDERAGNRCAATIVWHFL